MSRVKIYLSCSAFARAEFNPVISGLFSWEPENGKVYIRHKSKDKFKFSKKEDYSRILQMESDECGEVTVEVERLVNGQYQPYWTGYFTMFNCTVNKTKCFIEVTPEPVDDFRCFEDMLSEEQNIFDSNFTTVLGDIGEYETITCIDVVENATCSDFYSALYGQNSSCIDTNEWCFKENIVKIDGVQKQYCDSVSPTFFMTHETVWHRIKVTTDCSHDVPVPPTFGSGWTLLENNCLVDQTAAYWKCPSSGGLVGPYTRGRLFSDVLEEIVSNLSCGLTIKSDFFNINPIGDAPSNIAYTYAQNNLHNITVHQKSDIKRPNASNGSTFDAWNLKAKDWFEDLFKIFNVWTDVVDGVLIIEHYSFFTQTTDWDLTSVPMNLQYDYSGNENVKSEAYFWSDEVVSSEFKSKLITYDCGEEEKEQRCALINTDLQFIQNTENSELISDEGFVLVANSVIDNQHYVIDNNEPLSWHNLHESLHVHGRLYKSGKINNIAQNFLSWLPYRKQEPFKTDYEFNGVVFNPNNLKTTSLGDGTMGSATHNVLTCKLELELKY